MKNQILRPAILSVDFYTFQILCTKHSIDFETAAYYYLFFFAGARRFAAFLAGREDPQLWCAVQMLYYHFIRIRELGRLRIGDINFDQGTILVRDTVNLKSGKPRIMCLRGSLLAYMREIGYDQCDPKAFIFGTGGRPAERAVSINVLSNHWRDFRKKHKIAPVYKLYAAKHTGNTAMAMSGLSAQLQMLQNGHQSLNTTQIYIDKHNVDIEKLRTVAESMQDF